MPYGESPYIFGIHDAGGQGLMTSRKGWVVVSEEVGNGNPAGDYTTGLAASGYGVIVRINHAYHPNGTLPYDNGAGANNNYEIFAQRAAALVARSSGAHIWVIGNESNLSHEWPNGQPITAERYARAFQLVRSRIKSLPGHAGDQVVMQGVGPWNTELRDLPGNPLQLPDLYGWVAYFGDIINRLGPNGVDGIALHTYTHGGDVSKITSRSKTFRAGPTKIGRFDDFRAYVDFMNTIPAWGKQLPVYITETNPVVESGAHEWPNVNSGWVKAAYAEINNWNRLPMNQKIRALCLYRWWFNDYQISGKQEVINDFNQAMSNDYQWATTPACSRIGLKTNNGQFVCAEGGGGRELVANRPARGAWETFELIRLPQGGNQIALKASNGQYVCAEGGGGGAVNVNRPQVGAWETFELVPQGGNCVSFKTNNAQYLSAENGGGGLVLANRPQSSYWETFELSCV